MDNPGVLPMTVCVIGSLKYDLLNVRTHLIDVYHKCGHHFVLPAWRAATNIGVCHWGINLAATDIILKESQSTTSTPRL